jgi:hypothetical protein
MQATREKEQQIRMTQGTAASDKGRVGEERASE